MFLLFHHELQLISKWATNLTKMLHKRAQVSLLNAPMARSHSSAFVPPYHLYGNASLVTETKPVSAGKNSSKCRRGYPYL